MGIDAARPSPPPARAAGLPDIEEGRRRAVIESITPEVDGGRFPIKRTPGERVEVEADVFADGHDVVRAVLLHRRAGEAAWSEVEMVPVGNDRWRAGFEITTLAPHEYAIEGWVDAFRTWERDLRKRLDGGAPAEDVDLALRVGAGLLEAAAGRAAAAGDPAGAERLRTAASMLASGAPLEARVRVARDASLVELADRQPDRRFATRSERVLRVLVDRERARFGAWYEFFPRSTAPEPGRHGTFRDAARRLEYIAGLGFDVAYLPPIHPIGRSFRKGRNNALTAEPGDPGSPWAIGGPEGGHTAVHPELGTLDDFRAFVRRAEELGLEVALDIAFQVSPDHPYVREHPEWFRRRPDGSVQYAENPPKKYQDIYPFDFETDAWRELWAELRGVVEFWLDQGVRIFRVDNPHTKPFAFWEWLIGTIRADYPDVIFLSEAFTRPKVLYRLAKLGFDQSYNYFPWRNTKAELTDYLTELTQTPVREYTRPSLWTNTPDILTEFLQTGGRPAFAIRFVLAATLGASYGIYGPAFELLEATPREPGSEEYLNSEKYELRSWPLDRPDSLAPLIARVNRIRHENPALQGDWSLRFHPVDDDDLICYSKVSADGANAIVVVVSLDPHAPRAGTVELPIERFGIDPRHPYRMHDLLTDAVHLWHGSRNHVALTPEAPARIYRLERRVRTEREFEYYL
ncbi:MAG TPA: alpha-1,4-glucan--maltose-1-phosphate maltosyltransferase [Candidatus Limnocylindrales bacterium]|nr:alpha-1,4-glucan--maltose-1-phosphate maltosyltransferase [Candidatus Limnocylindrales bacterium]